MTRKSFASLPALFGAAIPMDALARVRGMTNPLGRGWVQVTATRAVLLPGRYTPDRILDDNARNGVGSAKVRRKVRGF